MVRTLEAAVAPNSAAFLAQEPTCRRRVAPDSSAACAHEGTDGPEAQSESGICGCAPRVMATILGRTGGKDRGRNVSVGSIGSVHLVDAYAPKKMSEWWRRNTAEARSLVHVSEGMFTAGEAAMQCISITLGQRKRHPDERAVLMVAQHEPNRCAMLWLAGRNDVFYHMHILPRLSQAGIDVFALDLRRCGRARFSTDGVETTPALLAHDSADFTEYYEEIDAALQVSASL